MPPASSAGNLIPATKEVQEQAVRAMDAILLRWPHLSTVVVSSPVADVMRRRASQTLQGPKPPMRWEQSDLHSDSCLIMPHVKLKLVDVVGAADAFVGAFCHGLASGLSEVDAIHLGMACASDSVTREGTQASFPTRERCVELGILKS